MRFVGASGFPGRQAADSWSLAVDCLAAKMAQANADSWV